jgi:hypothetical protein
MKIIGNGYEFAAQVPASLQGIESYSFVFSHPSVETLDKHKTNIIGLISSDMDQKVKYFYDQVNKKIQVSL